MAEPTLTEVFGAGATQTSGAITISKADLAAVGLTAAAGNTGESLLAAIVLKAKAYLTVENFTANIDQSITVVKGFDSVVSRDVVGQATGYRQSQLSLNLHSVDSFVIDPDSY